MTTQETPEPGTEERFWSKVRMTDTCWVWTGATIEGYGQFFANGKSRLAHRIAYEALVGPIPEGMTLDHLCRNRACVRPSHLEPVTSRENILRGTSPSAVHARKTKCPKGHPYDEANTYRAPDGGRGCRICILADGRTRRSCEVCGKSIARPSLARHVRNVHGVMA